MGLDIVELIMAIEEEFGIDIANEDAEQLTTVGELYDHLRKTLHSTTPAQCGSRKLFYRVRKAIVDSFGVSRRSITLDSRLADLVPVQDLEDGWPYLTLFSDFEFPVLSKDGWFGFGGRRKSTDLLTIRELVTTMMTLNAEKLLVEPGSDDEIWIRMTQVIQRQLNIELREIQPDASFTKDLAID